MQDKALNNKIEKQPGCVAEALCIMGNKWTALIILELANGPCRFTTIESKLSGISPRTLAQRLDFLKEKDIISKQSFNEVPPRVVYTLTEKGNDLIHILKSMAEWGNKYHT